MGEPSGAVAEQGVTKRPTQWGLASPYGGGGTANAVTERVPTLFFQTSVFKIRNAATLSVTAPAGPCQRAAARPVAALTVHRTVIHYRDFASLTPKGRAKWAGGRWERSSKGALRAPVHFSVLYHPLASPFGGEPRALGGMEDAIQKPRFPGLRLWKDPAFSGVFPQATRSPAEWLGTALLLGLRFLRTVSLAGPFLLIGRSSGRSGLCRRQGLRSADRP